MDTEKLNQIRSRYAGMSLAELEHERELEAASALHHGLDLVFHAGSSRREVGLNPIRTILAKSYAERYLVLGEMIQERARATGAN